MIRGLAGQGEDPYQFLTRTDLSFRQIPILLYTYSPTELGSRLWATVYKHPLGSTTEMWELNEIVTPAEFLVNGGGGLTLWNGCARDLTHTDVA